MAKHRCVWNKNKYEKYVKAGHGQGNGAAYLPWIRIQSFSSVGITSRIYSYKTNRVHHLLSRNELYYFYLLEWADEVVDIREQFPLLDLELACDIAAKAGIQYPKDNISGFPYVLTCDFMITTKSGFQARTIKNSKDLEKRRTLEKLEIERRYWKTQNIEWHIVTENEISMKKAKYIEWLYTAAELPNHLTDIKCQEEMMRRLTIQPAQKAAEWFDEQYEFPNGSGLEMIKHLLWAKRISLDINSQIVLREQI